MRTVSRTIAASMFALAALLTACGTPPPTVHGGEPPKPQTVAIIQGLPEDQKTRLRRILEDAGVRPPYDKGQPLSDYVRWKLASSGTEVLLTFLVGQLDLELVNSSPGAEQRCRVALDSIVVHRTTLGPVQHKAWFEYPDEQEIRWMYRVPPQLLRGGVPDAVTRWLREQAKKSRDPDLSAAEIEQLFGWNARRLSSSTHPRGLFNVQVGLVYKAYPHGEYHLNPSAIVHVEGLTPPTLEDVGNERMSADRVLYLSGSKYILARCEGGESHRWRQPMLCPVEAIAHTPIRNYSYIDRTSEVIGLHSVLTLGKMISPDPSEPTPGSPWLVELSQRKDDPRATVQFTELRLEHPWRHCTFQTRSWSGLPSLEDVLK